MPSKVHITSRLSVLPNPGKAELRSEWQQLLKRPAPDALRGERFLDKDIIACEQDLPGELEMLSCWRRYDNAPDLRLTQQLIEAASGLYSISFLKVHQTRFIQVTDRL